MTESSKRVEKSLHISQDVVAQIITNCVCEIDGVYAIAPIMKTPRQFWLRQENFGNIKISLVEDVLSISVGVILKKDAKAVKTAEQIQEKIKGSVQSMLGLTVAKVNVTLCGVHYQEDRG